MTVQFLGIDLAWQSERNPTGACALSLRNNELQLTHVAPPLRGLYQVEDFISNHLTADTVVAIDAPLVIANRSGLRGCEREIGVRYGARHASCHASNLTLYPNAPSVQLTAWLEKKGFAHASSEPGRQVMLEVYPHAAFVALFNLPSIIRYKKGRTSDKCTGLRRVQQTLCRLPITGVLLTDLLERDPAGMRGRDRKSYEDSLDAVFCAYLAFHFWKFGLRGSEIFGDAKSGYIVNPRLSFSLSPLAAA